MSFSDTELIYKRIQNQIFYFASMWAPWGRDIVGGESLVTIYMCDITLVHIRDYQGVTNDG